MEILNERPEGMSFKDYRTYLKEQKAWIKKKKEGVLYYTASYIFYAPEDEARLFGLRRTNPPFVGKMKDVDIPITM